MEKLKDKLWEELEKIDRKQDLNPGDLELAHKLTDTIKNIDKICILEEEAGYSQEGNGGGYNSGNSYANRGQHYVRGHYSRGNGSRGGRNGYSRDGGRSEMMEHLEMALDSADEQDRESIKRFMRRLENV